MSFFSNFQSERAPGPINGNATQGLNERICIQANRVFDACIKQGQNNGINLALTNMIPSNPTYPLTFISARSSSSTGEIASVQVDRLPDRENAARVQVAINIPMEVLYTDANGVEGKASSVITVTEDVILFVPQPSIMPYEIQSVVSAVAPEGTFNPVDNTFNVDVCLTVVLKVLIKVDILIPSYGYCIIPPAQDYAQEMCAGFFELPLYPQGAVPSNNNNNNNNNNLF